MNRKSREISLRMAEIRIGGRSELSDAQLVRMVEGGMPEAFQVLVDRYDALVRSVAAKFLDSDHMALEDACQETFLKALSRIGDLRKPERFKSWLCAIARNQALDTARRRRRVVYYDSTGDDGNTIGWDIPDKRSDPSELHDRSEVAGVVQDILGEIPDMYRYPITLRYEDELEYKDIAKLIGKPLGTVKSLIHRGKALIRKELTRRAWGSDGAQVLAS